jgi:hypothetical protein
MILVVMLRGGVETKLLALDVWCQVSECAVLLIVKVASVNDLTINNYNLW